jgi:MFS family permease
MPSKRPAVLALLCTVQFVVVLDVTIVAIALPAVRRSLGFGTESLQWVVSAYTLTFGGLLVAAGRAADLYGRRRLFRAGLLVFGGASLACAVAPSAPALVAARAVQGAGAAVVAPAALALLGAAFPEPAARRRAVAWWTAAAAGGGASGWMLGGVLVETLGWPAVFAVNVPLCAAAAVLTPLWLRESRAGTASLDLAGAVAVTAGLALLVHGLPQAEPVAVAAAAAVLIVFAWIEHRAPAPILPAWTLRRPGFAAANGVAVALTAATTPAMLLAVLYQQEVMHRSALAAGLWCTPFNVAVIAGSLIAAHGRPRPAMAGGLAAVGAGALALTALVPAALALAFVLMGAGLGRASVASTASGTAALPEEAQGIASGVLNAAAQVGTALGLATFVPLAAGSGYRTALAATAAVALVAAVAVAAGSPAPSRRRRAAPCPD